MKKYLLAGAALLIAAGAGAQTPNASQQVDSLQQRRELERAAQSLLVTNGVPELYAGEASDLGPQSVLQIKPRRTWIEAYADAQYFYSDNIFLANQNPTGGDVLVSTVQAALAPSAFEVGDGFLSPRVGYRQQWFSYGLTSSKTVQAIDLATGTFKNAELDQFDFNALTIFSDVAWSRNNWTFTLGGDFCQLMDSSAYNEFYKEYVPRWAVRRDFSLCPATAFSIGYEGDYRLTDTPNTPPTAGDNFNDRTDHSLVIVGSWQLCRHAILQPSYRFQYTHYTATTRDDYLNSFGLALYCPVTENITLRAYVTYDDLNTDGYYAQSYNKLDAGGGVTLSVRF
jgi:hypothetical protein